jgi:hypothetical protein
MDQFNEDRQLWVNLMGAADHVGGAVACSERAGGVGVCEGDGSNVES